MNNFEIKELVIDGIKTKQIEKVKEAISIISSQPMSSSLEMWLLYAQAYVHRTQFNFELAKLRFNQLLRIKNVKEEKQLFGRALNSLGIVYHFTSEWDKALNCYELALDFQSQQEDYLQQGILLHNISLIYARSGVYHQAIQYAEQAIDILKQNANNQQWQLNLSRAYNSLGIAYFFSNQLTKAEKAYLIFLKIEKYWNINSDNIGYAYENLGETYQQLKEYEKAKEHLQLALDVFIKTQNQREIANVYWRLGQIELDVGEISEADLYFQKALQFAKQATHNDIITDIILDQASLAESQGDIAEAFAKTQEALAYAESMRANISLAADRARMTAVRINAYEQMVRRLLLRGDIAQAYYHTEMSKSRTFIEMLGQREVRQPDNVPAEWLAEEQNLRQQLKTLYPDRTNQQAQIETLETELHQVRERIRVQAVEYQSFQTAVPLTLQDVQTRLPTGAVLIEYFAVEDEICAFVITSEQISTHTLPMTLPMLIKAFRPTGQEGELAGLHNLTRAADHRLRPAWILKTLYQRLIEPLEEAIASANLLCLVPHGLLHYVPFHALYKQTTSGNQYLATPTRPIIYASSATVLLDYCQTKPSAETTGCLAVGYDGSMLSQAQAEAQAIVNLMGGKALVGDAASRENILQHAGQFRYLHLSCHGWFNSVWPMASSLELADQPLDMSDVLRLLSLQAELVCLSACETGRSHVLKGDELIGLARAFMYAGTPSVLVSHWVVDELSTRLFMELFYEELLRCQTETNPSPPTALALTRTMTKVRELPYTQLKQWVVAQEPDRAEAMLQFWADSAGLGSIQQFDGSECLLAHPYYWAAFFLVGDRLGQPA